MPVSQEQTQILEPSPSHDLTPRRPPLCSWHVRSFCRLKIASVNLWSRYTSVTRWAPETMNPTVTPGLCKPWGITGSQGGLRIGCPHQPVDVDLEVSSLGKSKNVDALRLGT